MVIGSENMTELLLIQISNLLQCHVKSGNELQFVLIFV